MNEKKIVIDQTPIPQGRPRVTRWGTFDPNKDSKNWIRLQIREQFNEKLECPIEVEIMFFMPIPKSTSKKKQIMMMANEIKHVKRSDLDNLYKLYTDCMTEIVYKDDSQIHKCYIEKMYSDHPRVEILIKWE